MPAQAGKMEIAGLMQGKTDGDANLPVEATETRVNVQADADEYMVDHSKTNRQGF